MLETTEPAHYRRGPSGAHQWLICTAAPEENDRYPQETSDAADEGTAAHWLLEQTLLAWLDDGTDQVATMKRRLDGVILAGHDTGCVKHWPITGEMVEGVQLAVDTVLLDARKKGTRLFVEKRVRLDRYMALPEPVGGTADILLYMPRSRTLKVMDFKYGAGKLVDVGPDTGKVYVPTADGGREVIEAHQITGLSYNPQIGLYGLAAMLELEQLLGESREVKWVELTIIQPRIETKRGKVRRRKLAPLQFLALESALLRAVNGPRVHLAGDHCFFCRHKPHCEAHTQARMVANGFIAEDAPMAKPQDVMPSPDVFPALMQSEKALTTEQLGQLFPLLSTLKARIKAVENETRSRLLQDETVPNVMLAEGPGKRLLGGNEKDIDAAVHTVLEEREDLTEADLYEPRKLKSVAQLEKAMGRSGFKASALGKLEVHEAGGPVLVPADSDRKPYMKCAEFSAESPGSHLL